VKNTKILPFFSFSVMFKPACLFLFLLVSMVSCKSEDKAKAVDRMIREHMREVLNDYSSYEPVKTEIDSAFSDQTEADKLLLWRAQRDLRDARHLLARTQDSLAYLAGIYPTDTNQLHHTIDRLSNKPQEFVGWKVYHQFRAKNQFNATRLSYVVFWLDSSRSAIVKSKWESDIEDTLNYY
jgi:hypothetical protein